MSKLPAPLPVTTLRHESAMGSWSISTCQALKPLAPLIATIWFGQGSVSYQRDRILPSAQSQLLINLGPPQYMIDPGPPEQRIPFRDVWYSGLRQDPIGTEAPHGSALLGVAFRAHGAFPWMGGGLSEVKEQVLPLAELLGSGVLALLNGTDRVPWAELAAHCGYYDQAHLSNDFRRFAGVSPAAYLRLQQPDSQSVVIR
jgi:AraC-like DNA-binding protein